MMDEEIRQALNEVREMNQMCGNINMKLTNIVTQRGQDWKKKLEAEYQRGLNDAWEAARKIVCDDELDWNTLLHIFNRGNFDGIFGDFSPSEAIDKLKSYKEKQKADDEIKVGDEVLPFYTDITGVVTLIDGDTIYVLWRDGSSTSTLKLKEVTKTGRHFDIPKILEDMRHD